MNLDHIGARQCVQLRACNPAGGNPPNKLLTTAFEASFECITVM